jgi:hypothetical protein
MAEFGEMMPAFDPEDACQRAIAERCCGLELVGCLTHQIGVFIERANEWIAQDSGELTF